MNEEVEKHGVHGKERNLIKIESLLGRLRVEL